MTINLRILRNKNQFKASYLQSVHEINQFKNIWSKYLSRKKTIKNIFGNKKNMINNIIKIIIIKNSPQQKFYGSW